MSRTRLLLLDRHAGQDSQTWPLTLDLQPCLCPDAYPPRPIASLGIRGQFREVLRSPQDGTVMALTLHGAGLAVIHRRHGSRRDRPLRGSRPVIRTSRASGGWTTVARVVGPSQVATLWYGMPGGDCRPVRCRIAALEPFDCAGDDRLVAVGEPVDNEPAAVRQLAVRVGEPGGAHDPLVAVARKVLRLVYYGLRDGEIRCLAPGPRGVRLGHDQTRARDRDDPRLRRRGRRTA